MHKSQDTFEVPINIQVVNEAVSKSEVITRVKSLPEENASYSVPSENIILLLYSWFTISLCNKTARLTVDIEKLYYSQLDLGTMIRVLDS